MPYCGSFVVVVVVVFLFVFFCFFFFFVLFFFSSQRYTIKLNDLDNNDAFTVADFESTGNSSDSSRKQILDTFYGNCLILSFKIVVCVLLRISSSRGLTFKILRGDKSLFLITRLCITAIYTYVTMHFYHYTHNIAYLILRKKH